MALSDLHLENFLPALDEELESSNPFNLPLPSEPVKTINYAALIDDPELRERFTKVISGDFVVKVWENDGNIDDEGLANHSLVLLFKETEDANPFGSLILWKIRRPNEFHCRVDWANGAFENIEHEAVSFLEVSILDWTLRYHARKFDDVTNINLLFHTVAGYYAIRRMWAESYKVTFLSANWGAMKFHQGVFPQACWLQWPFLPQLSLEALGKLKESADYSVEVGKLVKDSDTLKAELLASAATALMFSEFEKSASLFIQSYNVRLSKVKKFEKWCLNPIEKEVCKRGLDLLLITYRAWTTHLKMSSSKDPRRYVPDPEKHETTLALLIKFAGWRLKERADQALHGLIKPQYHSPIAARNVLFAAMSAGGMSKFHTEIMKARFPNRMEYACVLTDKMKEEVSNGKKNSVQISKKMLQEKSIRAGLIRQCVACKKTSDNLRGCSACKAFTTLYCCRLCQIKDWPHHKSICQKLRS